MFAGFLNFERKNIMALDSDLPFELKCDVSDYIVRAVLGQHNKNMLHVIYYATRTLTDVELCYYWERVYCRCVCTWKNFTHICFSQGW